MTMSQTSSTVSLGNGNEQGAATQSRTRTMSSEINTDELPVSSSIDSSNLPCPMSVALIVIGDELLKGMTPDSNIISAARALRANNVTLARVSIISDDSQDILEEIQRVTKEVSWKLVCHICAYTFLYHALMMIAFTLYLKGRCSDNEWWCWSNT